MRRRYDRHDRTRWGRSNRRRRGRRRGVPNQAPPGGLLFLVVAGVIVHQSTQPDAASESSLQDLGSRAGGWAVDYAIDVLEVVAEAGGNPT